MSFSDAIGQIDQILQWQQDLEDPQLLQSVGSASSATGATASTSTGASSDSGAGSFADTLTQAQSSTLSSDLLGASDSSDSTASTDTSSLLGGGDSQLIQMLTSAGSGDGAASAASGTGGTAAAADFSGDLASVLTPAADGTTPATGLDAGYATGGVSAAGAVGAGADTKVQAMVSEANSLVGKPYVWGGGHDGWGPQAGYDCSGFVSKVLHAGGYLSSPQDTVTLPSAPGIESGPGQQVTIYDRTDAGSGNDHVIIDLGGQFYESGGEQGAWGGGGGVQKIAAPSASYLASFNRILHPAGL